MYLVPAPFFSTTTIQPKLTIGQPNDKYEQQADSMADHVMQMAPGSSIQRACSACEEKKKLHDKPLMMKADGSGGGVATTALTSQLGRSKGGGATLPKATQRSIGRAFKVDFNGVRIHTDSNAVQMNRGLGARAFTHGADIYFNRGEYRPESSEGKRLLAHELTHVVQQKSAGKQIQRSCTPAEQALLYSSMKSFCNQKRKCNMQTDNCATANAKVAAGYGC